LPILDVYTRHWSNFNTDSYLNKIENGLFLPGAVKLLEFCMTQNPDVSSMVRFIVNYGHLSEKLLNMFTTICTPSPVLSGLRFSCFWLIDCDCFRHVKALQVLRFTIADEFQTLACYCSSRSWPADQLTNWRTARGWILLGKPTVASGISQHFMNPKVYYRTHTRPLVLIMSHINLVHTTLSYFSNIRFNILLPSTSKRTPWPERTISTERPPLVREVSANFWG
jgi:hypothetical protein